MFKVLSSFNSKKAPYDYLHNQPSDIFDAVWGNTMSPKFYRNMLVERGGLKSLSLHLDRLRAPIDADVTTPLLPSGMEADEYVQGLFDRMIQSGGLEDAVLALEIKEMEKVGSFSRRLGYEDWGEAKLHEYYDKPSFIPGKTHFENGEMLRNLGSSDFNIRHAIEEATLLSPSHVAMLTNLASRLRPLDIQDTTRFIHQTTSSGFPGMGRRGVNMDHDLDLAMSVLNSFNHSPDKYGESELLVPAVLGTRITPSGEFYGKTRIVWMYPLSINLIETAVFQVLFPALRKHVISEMSPLYGAFPAWIHQDFVDMNVERLIRRSLVLGPQADIVSTDFSGFDQHLSHSHMVRMIGIINTFFQHKVDGVRTMMAAIAAHLYSIPIYTPNGLVSGNHGLPSGSGLTNLAQSLFHWEELDSIISGTSNDPDPGNQNKFLIQGDDSLSLIRSKELLDESWNSRGMTVNTGKGGSLSSDGYVDFLQRRYYISSEGDVSRGVFSAVRAANRIIRRERYISPESGWSGKDDVLRSLAILENCKHHPLHTMLIDYVIEHDKYGLGTRGTDDFNSVLDRAETFVTDFTSQGEAMRNLLPKDLSGRPYVRGLRQFKTVRYIIENYT